MATLFKHIINKIPRSLLIRLSYFIRPLMTVYLKGHTYTDPIDGKRFRKFLPYGYAHQRPNVLSPSTLSLERHRLLWLYLKNKTDFFSNKNIKVLHFAPEQCFLKRFKALKFSTYTTTDLSSPIADVKADICNLPFENNSYDIIFCNHVLEHIPNDDKAMRELYRVMKPGGWGIFQVPLNQQRSATFEDNSITDKVERTRLFGQYDHVRVYGMDYFEKLKDSGFRVDAVNYTVQLSEENINKYRLAKGELLPLVFKAGVS